MKIIIFSCLLIVSFVNAQEVSPYYPAKNVVNDPYDFTSQITYFDMNYITNNISEFLTYRMNMTVTKTDNSKLLHDGGSYTIIYGDKIAQSGNANLVFNYTIGIVDNVYTIKSLKITGSKERLISFFVEFWQTSKNFTSPSGNSDISLLTGQDVAKFYFNKGKPYITVTNNTYKSLDEFKVYFQNLKSKS
ncbi:hypothetical protein NJT12_03400 [Flavobacterium sp. AC]|uniref:DUF4468 domain-containing protein n=1 Tax=Flavobacterium azizsancarii TaxID=2961580 RepID=A0ABT4W8S9_9FLAO|nr:hypothetical protein [Flavobacterium azizsancarii]MDA6068657.1 hypothetical protein [Flavobacterium azizsancarii]